MGSMKGKQEKIDAAFGRIADMMPSGNLLASADPVGFLDTVAAELKELRAENVDMKGTISITQDRVNDLEKALRDISGAKAADDVPLYAKSFELLGRIQGIASVALDAISTLNPKLTLDLEAELAEAVRKPKAKPQARRRRLDQLVRILNLNRRNHNETV